MMRFIESIVFRDPSSQTQSACIHRRAGRRYSIDFQFLDGVCVRAARVIWREKEREREVWLVAAPRCVSTDTLDVLYRSIRPGFFAAVIFAFFVGILFFYGRAYIHFISV